MIGTTADVPPGGRLIVDVEGRSIGVFNVAGRYYALHNRCPHKRGALCEGPITGTVLPTTGRDFPYGREGEIATGQAIADPRVRARTFRVEVDGSDLVVVT